MKEQNQPNTVQGLVTKSSIIKDLKLLGVKKGSTVIVHSSLSSMGWVCGGAVSVIQALQGILSEEGTLVMPTHTGDNSDPSEWENPPVPSEWWETIKRETPAFEPNVTPTFFMGKIAETFRSMPDVVRSDHPTVSFAAWGKNKHIITENQSLFEGMGDNSPLGKVYELDGHVLLLGVDHENNSSMHLAEHRLPYRTTKKAESAVMEGGVRVWKEYHTLSYQEDLFKEIGQAFEEEHSHSVQKGLVGKAACRHMKQREVVDYTYHFFMKQKKSNMK